MSEKPTKITKRYKTNTFTSLKGNGIKFDYPGEIVWPECESEQEGIKFDYPVQIVYPGDENDEDERLYYGVS